MTEMATATVNLSKLESPDNPRLSFLRAGLQAAAEQAAPGYLDDDCIVQAEDHCPLGINFVKPCYKWQDPMMPPFARFPVRLLVDDFEAAFALAVSGVAECFLRVMVLEAITEGRNGD